MKNLETDFRLALTKNKADLNEIEARRCASDRFDGIEYSFYGPYVPVRPIIDVVAEKDDLAIESISLFDGDEHHLGVFVADLSTPDRQHPAFTA